MALKNYAFSLLLFAAIAAAAPSRTVRHGGWVVGDVYVYNNGCRTEEAMNAALRHFRAAPEERFLNFECFSLPRFIPMRLIRPVRAVEELGGRNMTMWEVWDLMRETAYTVLPPRNEVIYTEEAI